VLHRSYGRGPAPPPAGFNTYEGNGEGRYNGISGYKAKWKFTDAGEPGTNDSARIVITDSSGTTVVLIVDGKLDGGNHQATDERSLQKYGPLGEGTCPSLPFWEA